jgi:hypothetical protein
MVCWKTDSGFEVFFATCYNACLDSVIRWRRLPKQMSSPFSSGAIESSSGGALIRIADAGA